MSNEVDNLRRAVRNHEGILAKLKNPKSGGGYELASAEKSAREDVQKRYADYYEATSKVGTPQSLREFYH